MTVKLIYQKTIYPTWHVIKHKCLETKHTWTPHVSKSLSFSVIKHKFNGYNVILSMQSILNPHTTNSVII